jgi:hypothetical protein
MFEAFGENEEATKTNIPNNINNNNNATNIINVNNKKQQTVIYSSLKQPAKKICTQNSRYEENSLKLSQICKLPPVVSSPQVVKKNEPVKIGALFIRYNAIKTKVQ